MAAKMVATGERPGRRPEAMVRPYFPKVAYLCVRASIRVSDNTLDRPIGWQPEVWESPRGGMPTEAAKR